MPPNEHDATRYARDATQTGRPRFHVTHDDAPSDVLLAGFSSFGLAGLTAANFLVERLDLEETGHVAVESLPAITPFEDGTPRHHTRFFSRPDLDVTVLAGELFVPLYAADAFSNAVFDWLDENPVAEICVVDGVPIPHDPDQHRTYYVATEDYRTSRLPDSAVEPMPRGFLEGVNAALVQRGIDSPLAAGLLATPVHAQAPDVDAAIRLVETTATTYDLDVDTAPLQEYADAVRDYYEELEARLQDVAEEQRPDDRMFM